MLTVWFPLMDASEENGCLQVVPGSHEGKVLTHCPGFNPKTGKINRSLNAGGLQITVGEKRVPSLGLTGEIRRNIPLDAEKLLSGTYQ